MRWWLWVGVVLGWCGLLAQGAEPEVIAHHGRIVTVDARFSMAEAVAWSAGKLVAVGSNVEVLKLRGPKTELIDLQGKFVLPGLIDSHVHPPGAAMHEWDAPIPEMESIADVLAYIRTRTTQLEPGEWIVLRQVFITRLREQRYPTKAELDEAAPQHPVMFSTGPDASVNSLALKLSGIDKDFQPTGAGKIERDPATGEPTGILRSAGQYVKARPKSRPASEAERDEQLARLFTDYNSVGLTGIIDRNASDGGVAQYVRLRASDRLTLRVGASLGVGTSGAVSEIQERIRGVAQHTLRKPDPWVRIVGLKTFLDGGMLTGSAYMREPWGVSRIYSIDDPRYRGLRYIEPEVLTPIVRTAVEAGLQFTAHSVGDGAVHSLLDAYEEVDRSLPIRATRPCITHSNFMSREAIERAARLGVVLDIQPAWLYLDGNTLHEQFGYDRLRYFQPLRSIFAAGVIVGGGSDHMQKIGSFRSVNPYNPFLGMQTSITRRARGLDRPLHPEEALTAEQAIRYYTINNAHLLFMEDQIGSLEPGKWADLIVVDRDLLSVPVDTWREARVLQTFVAGRQVYCAP